MINRRDFLKSVGVGASAFAFGLKRDVWAEESKEKRPNIVLIFTDDQPQNAMGCMGNKVISTPNMDKLAAEGVLFENSFVTTSICCCSRASLLTGQHMARHGINSFEKPLSAEQWDQTYPVLLRKAGYRTAFLGKLAVGAPKTQPPELCLPVDRFDMWYGFPQGISFIQNVDGKKRYLTTVMEEKVAQFLKEQPKEQPFLIVMALKEPHGPLDMEDPDLPPNLVKGEIPRPKTLTQEAFDKLPVEIRKSLNGVEPGPKFLKPRSLTDESAYQKNMAQGYRYISRADIAVGRIMAALKEQGFDNNTVVIHTSDNGSMNGAHRLVGKWNMYEESIRVPYIIRDPRLPEAKGVRRTQMVLNIDLAPTMLAMAGVPVPAGMQGIDLQPVLRDPKAPGREEWYYEHDIVGLSKNMPCPRCEGVRTERWKYIHYKDTQPVVEELFDLKADPMEEHDLAKDPAHAETLAGLRAKCDEYRRKLR